MNDQNLKFQESNIKTFLVAFVITMIFTTIIRFLMGFRYYYIDIAFLSLFILTIPFYLKLNKEKPVNILGIVYVAYIFIVVIILDSTQIKSFNYQNDFINFLASLTIFIPIIVGFITAFIKIKLENRKYKNNKTK